MFDYRFIDNSWKFAHKLDFKLVTPKSFVRGYKLINVNKRLMPVAIVSTTNINKREGILSLNLKKKSEKKNEKQKIS